MAGAVVYVAEKVRTLDPGRPLARAIAVHGGKIVAVGTREEALEAAPGAEVAELAGAVIVPGLADSHAHLLGLGQARGVVALGEARSLEEVLELVRRAPAESYQGDWLIGRGWDQNDWREEQRTFPTRLELDRLFPKTPVLLTRIDGHAVWANTGALRRAKLTRETKDPPGGRILRDEAGEPTGVLVDSAIDLVESSVPPLTSEQRQKLLKAAIEHCLRVGLTSVHDAGVDLPTFTLLEQWDAAGLLPLRVYAMAEGRGESAQAFLERGPFHGRNLELRAVKFLADGAMGSRGAALEEPYSDEPSHRGLLLFTPEELAAHARDFSARGFQVAVHAIGDRANRIALDVLGSLERERPGSRPRIEHAQLLRLSDVPRFAKEKVIASMQPTHATSDMPWAEARVGKERVLGAYAWKSLLEAGAHLAFGSDFPVEEANPLLGIYAARTRQNLAGEPTGGWMPLERISGEQALAAFTVGAAYASFAEERRGKLAPGFDADFVALTVDPVEGEPGELARARVLRTVVAGEVVYRGP
ncbi:MAG: amidohydrolase [Myxococcales bacterium]|nr:amidohydrolase [Myxococcales bacterium]